MNRNTEFIDVDDGTLYCEDMGEGPPVVMVHGFTLDRRVWDNEFQALSHRFRAIRYDLRGHGKSSGVSGDFNHVEDLARLLAALDVKRAHLIGLSLGGWVAADFAIVHPQRVESVVLVDPYYPSSQPNDFDERFVRHLKTGRSEGLREGLSNWLADPLFATARKDAELDAKLNEIVIEGHGAQGDGALFLNVAKQTTPRERKGKSASDIGCRVLLLVGEHDLQRFQKVADTFSRLVPSITKVVVPKAGHLANMENPDFVWKQVESFLHEDSIDLSQLT